MNLTVNGEACSIPDGATVGVLAELRGVAQRGTAVAVDGIVVPRRQWDDHVLVDGQTVEVVRAVQGGLPGTRIFGREVPTAQVERGMMRA